MTEPEHQCGCGHPYRSHLVRITGECMRCVCTHYDAVGVTEPKTVAEKLDAAKSGEEFADVIQGLFGALERARDEEEGEE